MAIIFERLRKIIVEQLGGRKIEITIPAGVKTGERIRYKGARLKLDGRPGDLYVHVTVRD